MLNPARQRGVSLIEAMVALVIGAILMAVAAPNFSSWIAGSRIRATAEGVLAGLQYARSEATTRNTQVRFQLVDSLGSNCLRSNSGSAWVVDVVDANVSASDDSVEGKCNTAPSDTDAPSILQVRAGTETGAGTAVNADAAQVVFNGLGRQVAVAPVALGTVSIDITPTGGAQCAANGGKVTCLRIVISPAGQVRMCNPNIATGDPQAC